MGAAPMSVADIDARQQKVDAEVARLQARWPEEFQLGWRAGYLRKSDPPCDSAGYPRGLHEWPVDRKNAWWSGRNQGRIKLEKKGSSNG
jgi:hypothetical protein